MMERRISLRNDPAFMLAVVYTFGFLGMVFIVLVRGVPPESANVTQQLISIMSLIQGAIGGYYYGASKAQIDMQKGTNVQVSDSSTAVTVTTDTQPKEQKTAP